MSGSTSPPLPASQTENRKPKYASRTRLSRGWFKTAGWSHDQIQLSYTIAIPTQDPQKFDYQDVFRWRVATADIPLVIEELKKAQVFCESKPKEQIAPEPPKPRQLIFNQIPAGGEIQLQDLEKKCVPGICPSDVFVAEIAGLDRLGVIRKRIEGADTLFPVVFVSRMVV